MGEKAQPPGEGPSGAGLSGPCTSYRECRRRACVQSEWASVSWTDSKPPPPGGENRKGREGRRPPRPPYFAPTAAGLPPWTVSTTPPAPPSPPRSLGIRVEPTRAPGRREGQGDFPRLSATRSLFREPWPCPRCRRSHLNPARPGPPRGDPVPTSERQRRPQAYADGPCQRFPGAVDDAAAAQADLKELHPPHAARGPGRTVTHCHPRPPAGPLVFSAPPRPDTPSTPPPCSTTPRPLAHPRGRPRPLSGHALFPVGHALGHALRQPGPSPASATPPPRPPPTRPQP